MQPSPNATSDNPKMVTGIKNSYTETEMKALEQEFVDHKGPFLTLAEAFELAKAHQDQQPTHEKSA